jgi:hypothetical protein
LGGRAHVNVRISEQARAQYVALVPGQSVPAGTVVAAVHELPDGGEGPIYAMEKDDSGGWRYLVVSPSGLIEEQGALPLCVRCHAEGVSDSLFGPPRAQAAETRRPGKR